MVCGLDLVAEQLRIAAGEPLGFRQSDVVARGVAIECRVNAEDPVREFRPTPGLVSHLELPGGPFVRVDTHAYPGYRVSPHYDSLIAKLTVWAPSRAEALGRAERALDEFDVAGPGVRTTIPFVRQVLSDTEFRKGKYSTGLVERITAD
nr:acetyl-CoA carboxylase biotin carboxylase subunit [Micromonospora sp. DSM 115978]